MKPALNIALIMMLVWGCTKERTDEKVVARAGEKYLMLRELMASIPNNLSAEDSAELAGSMIQTWVHRELLYQQARLNLEGVDEEIEDRVEKYRQELYIFAYEKEQIDQKLDTNISEEEIVAFYDDNQDIFQLNDYILKFRYVKLKLNSPDIARVEEWIQSEDEEDISNLNEYCHKYAVKYHNDTNWIYFNDLLRELPIEVYNKESFLRSDNVMHVTDTEHVYILSIRDLQSKNTLSPIKLEHDRIKSLILNKRRLELLGSIRRKLYQNAVSHGNVIIYDKPQLPQ